MSDFDQAVVGSIPDQAAIKLGEVNLKIDVLKNWQD